MRRISRISGLIAKSPIVFVMYDLRVTAALGDMDYKVILFTQQHFTQKLIKSKF
ncbi:hypothetical protein GCM10009425_42380 [Pseudomonas asuensis]|uniref:Type II toxin-antitoxin system RelE/ParE family toxin n=1 Tax=Pseudomonas asuensis TaxID=1825787 RepID=A0ABQ2H3A5_9PSED|nr:hypothetical protein GCM10009425_42380 [Pseudomonas asuensis]